MVLGKVADRTSIPFTPIGRGAIFCVCGRVIPRPVEHRIKSRHERFVPTRRSPFIHEGPQLKVLLIGLAMESRARGLAAGRRQSGYLTWLRIPYRVPHKRHTLNMILSTLAMSHVIAVPFRR